MCLSIVCAHIVHVHVHTLYVNECTCARSHGRKVLQLLNISLTAISNYFISHTCGIVVSPSVHVHVYVAPQVIVVSFSCLLVFAMVDQYLYTKQRAVFYAAQGLNASAISRALSAEGLPYSPKSVSLLLRKLKAGQSLVRKRAVGRPSKTTQKVRDLIEEQMQRDNETTATELDHLRQANGIKLSRSTILHCHKQLGWTYCGGAYCQLIREPNKLKRLSWCMENQCS